MNIQFNNWLGNRRQKSPLFFRAPDALVATLISACLTIGNEVHADPILDANKALSQRNLNESLRILQEAADSGDIAAKGQLSSYLRNFPPPYRDIERACKIAKEASEAGDPTGLVTRAECVLTGAEKSFHPTTQARHFARQAWKKGSPAGGFMLYLIYSQDPQYRYIDNGKMNQSKYDSLAAMPVSERADQIEAIEALSDAIGAGHVNAATMGLAYLADASAPNNIDRMLSLSRFLKQNGEKISPMLTTSLQIAQEMQRLGNSHTSPSLFRNTASSSLMAAAIQLKRVDNTPCDLNQITLNKIKAEPVVNAEYLPISSNALKNTYLIKGTWTEAWTFGGCGKSAVMNIVFNSDGWSGARFSGAAELNKN